MATVFVGRLVRDPQVYTVNGRNKTLFTLAVERNYTDKQGNREVDYPPISAWNGLGEVCAKHLAKGRMVAVEGHYRSYVSEKNGEKEYGHEFVADNVKFLDSPNKGNNNNGNGQQNPNVQNQNYGNQQQVAPQQQQNPNQAQSYGNQQNFQPQQNNQQNFQPQQNQNWNNNQQNGNNNAPF